jgi:hypothetical protein
MTEQVQVCGRSGCSDSAVRDVYIHCAAVPLCDEHADEAVRDFHGLDMGPCEAEQSDS